MAGRTRVLLVDDHAMVRRGLRDFLEVFEDIEVVGEAADGPAGVEAAARLRPHVVVMDLNLPKLDGIAATREVRAMTPGVEVVALTAFAEEDKVMAALEAGAAGFLVKDAEADDVAAAIRAARAGEVYLDPAVAGMVARQLRTPAMAAHPIDDEGLTPRERDVLALVARGLSNRAIGSELGITERTARTHVSNILAKLSLTSRTQAALYAIEQGFGDADGSTRRRS
ncbi:MAG TPA: response regulator transcription factor [Clostridia bacterium]|nr:response regulator transcription factor [Clostridia bacterium]